MYVVDSASETETTHIDISPSIPTFYNEQMNSGKDKEEIDKLFLEVDWITEELQNKVLTYDPQKKDIVIDSASEVKVKFCKNAAGYCQSRLMYS